VNVDHTFIHRFKEYLINTNQLKDVTEQRVKITFGGKKYDDFAEEFAAEATIDFIKLMAEKIMPIMKLTREEYDDFVKEIENEIKDENNTDHIWYQRLFAMKM